MANLKNTRNQLGISLQAFAGLINCKQSQLSMAECGERNLPTASLTLLMALETALAKVISSTSHEQDYNDKTTSWLNRHIKTCELNRATLQLELEKTNEKMVEAQMLLQVASQLKDSPLFPAQKGNGMRLALLQRKAEKKYKDMQLEIVKLQLGIAGLNAEIASANTLKTA